MNQELLHKVLNSLVGIKEYWNGNPGSAVDAIETAIERADNAELNLREWLKQNPMPIDNTFSWLCGCGSWNGVNLPTCAVCNRNRNSDQKP